MGKLVVSEFVTLDGVFEDPGGSEGTEQGGWNLRMMGEEEGKFKFDELMAADALLLGRKTYDGFAEAWPKMEAETGDFGKKMNNMPKHVVSSTLKSPTWHNTQVISCDVSAIQKLKQDTKGNVLVYGSGHLVHWLLEDDLVDELALMVHPLVLGDGRKLLEQAHTKALQLSGVERFKSGIVVLTYVPKAQK